MQSAVRWKLNICIRFARFARALFSHLTPLGGTHVWRLCDAIVAAVVVALHIYLYFGLFGCKTF